MPGGREKKKICCLLNDFIFTICREELNGKEAYEFVLSDKAETSVILTEDEVIKNQEIVKNGENERRRKVC